jgi:hypothetical protein
MKTTEQLITEANAAIAELRSRGAVPFNLTISENVDIELRISSEGEGVFRTSEAVRADSWMHSVFLIGGQARDGRSHTYGMSVCRNATLHHQYLRATVIGCPFLFRLLPTPRGMRDTICVCCAVYSAVSVSGQFPLFRFLPVLWITTFRKFRFGIVAVDQIKSSDLRRRIFELLENLAKHRHQLFPHMPMYCGIPSST